MSNILSHYYSTNVPHDSFIAFINSRVQLHSAVTAAVEASVQQEELPLKTVLLKEGAVAHRLFFIKSGSARTFYLHNGKEITSWIYREGQLLTSWSSFFSRLPAPESIEVTEDTVVGSLTYDQLQALYATYPKMQQFGRLMLEEQLVFLDHFYKGFLFMTAKEKYELLLSYFPDVTQRVNLGHIATFLGISQETLSRIRKR